MSDPKVKIVLTIDGKQYEAGLDRADKGTDRFGKTSTRTAASVNQLSGAVKLLAGGFAAIQFGRLVSDIIDTNVEFDELHASLVTVTGSADEADIVFQKITDFASKTPYQLQEVVNAFIKLKALGLDPSEASLNSYGNTASAMGKSLDQMIEAVADASTGEFERLKEFGIKASVQGDKVSFRFRGITTTVRNSASDIEGYLRRIGDVEFAGGMERQMETLGGKFSNLEDAVSRLARSFGEESGLNSVLKDSIGLFTDFLNKLSGAPRSISTIEGEIAALEKRIERTTSRRGRRGGMMRRLADLRAELLEARMGSTDPEQVKRALDALDERINAAQARINTIPEDKRTQSIGSGRSRRASKFALENKALEKLIAERQALYERLDSLGNKPDQNAGTDTGGSTSTGPSALEQKLQRQLALYGQVGEVARVRYEVEQGALAKLSPADKARLIDMAEELEFRKANDAAIKDAIATQNEAIEADRQWAEQKRATAQAFLDTIQQQTLTEQDAENQRYKQQLEQLQTAEDLKLQTLVGYDELRARLKASHEERLTKITLAGLTEREKFQQLSAAAQAKTIFGFLASTTAAAARHNRALFRINQVAGIANAIISTQEGMAKALTFGPILGPPLAAIVAAAGAANVAAIASAKFGGAGSIGTYSASPATGLPTQTTAAASPYASSASANSTGNSGGTTVIEVAGRDTDTVTLAQMDQIWEQMQEAIERGDKILFRRNSAQGLELTEAAA